MTIKTDFRRKFTTLNPILEVVLRRTDLQTGLMGYFHSSDPLRGELISIMPECFGSDIRGPIGDGGKALGTAGEATLMYAMERLVKKML